MRRNADRAREIGIETDDAKLLEQKNDHERDDGEPEGKPSKLRGKARKRVWVEQACDAGCRRPDRGFDIAEQNVVNIEGRACDPGPLEQQHAEREHRGEYRSERRGCFDACYAPEELDEHRRKESGGKGAGEHDPGRGRSGKHEGNHDAG